MSNTFGFEKALHLMKEGKKVQRSKWRNEYCMLLHQAVFIWKSDTARGSTIPDMADILAEDWELVPDTFDFTEALKKLQEGRKVRRWDWGANEYWEIGASGHVYILPAGEKIVLHKSILKATDWVIYEGNEDE